MAASPAHVFAMKARAARTRDIDDLRLLADIIGLKFSRGSFADMHGILPGRTGIPEIDRCASRAFRLTTYSHPPEWLPYS